MARFKKGKSGNPNGRPKGAKSISPIIRQAIIDAFDELEAEGQPLSQILKELLKEKPLETLRAVHPYNPKEKNVEFDSGEVDILDIMLGAQPLNSGLAFRGGFYQCRLMGKGFDLKI